MPEAIVWIITIISVIFAFIGGHLLMTKVLSPFKNILTSVFKDEKATNGLMAILIVLVAVLVLQKAVELLVGLGNEVINIVSVLAPALDVMLSFGTYLGYLIIALFVVIALKNWK